MCAKSTSCFISLASSNISLVPRVFNRTAFLSNSSNLQSIELCKGKEEEPQLRQRRSTKNYRANCDRNLTVAAPWYTMCTLSHNICLSWSERPSPICDTSPSITETAFFSASKPRAFLTFSNNCKITITNHFYKFFLSFVSISFFIF